MISFPYLSSYLLVLAILFLSADGRSNSPWNRRFPILTGASTKSHHHVTPLILPYIRGGDSSAVPDSNFHSNTALPTPTSQRIGNSDNDIETQQTIPCITGGHILRAGKVNPEPKSPKTEVTVAGNTTDVVVESFVTKQDKATKKILKRHKQIAKKLRNRNSMNKRRKFMHFSWGMLFASLNHMVPRHVFLPVMSTTSGLILLLELLRYREGFGFINNIFSRVLGKALRKHELDGKFTGAFYYFSGVTLTSYLFPNSCATLGICQLAIADPTASFFGRATRHVYWSRIGNGFFGIGRNKGFLGFLGGAICCVPLNYRLLSLALAKQSAGVAAQTLAKPTVLAISLALGMAGALADLMVPTPALVLPKKVMGVRVPPFHLDDNIAIPIMSGWACTHILRFAGLPIPPAELTLAKYLVV